MGERSGPRDFSVIVQTEPWDEPNVSYIYLTRRSLDALAEVLADLMKRSGVRPGNKVLIYDFSTSLPAMVASRAYAPGLRRGSCEILGCSVMSVDGTPELAARSAFMFSMLQPEVLLIRSELVSVFRSNLEKGDMASANPYLELVLVMHPDPAPLPREVKLGPGRFSRRLLYKSDHGFFLGLLEDGSLYYPSGYYDVGCSSGFVEVRPLFVEGGRPHRTSLECGPGGVEVVSI